MLALLLSSLISTLGCSSQTTLDPIVVNWRCQVTRLEFRHHKMVIEFDSCCADLTRIAFKSLDFDLTERIVVTICLLSRHYLFMTLFIMMWNSVDLVMVSS
jgi:hypothetical protein